MVAAVVATWVRDNRGPWEHWCANFALLHREAPGGDMPGAQRRLCLSSAAIVAASRRQSCPQEDFHGAVLVAVCLPERSQGLLSVEAHLHYL